MKKGCVVKYKNPMPDEIGLTFTLLEDPTDGRVLAEANVNMIIRPSYILIISEIEPADKSDEDKSQ